MKGTIKAETPRTIVIEGREFPLPIVKRPFFGWHLYHRKLYLRIGRLVIEAGWYSGEPPCIDMKALEWFAGAGEVVVFRVQLVKAILCVSWDYGRR